VEHSAERCSLTPNETVHYDDLDDLRELEGLTEEEKKEAEPTAVP
jgi:hypothetical protein